MVDSLYDQFILYGDSLIQHSSNQYNGWSLAPALQNEYIRRMDVLNRGFSGFNTIQGLEVLPKVIPSPQNAKLRFLLILFGANDSCIQGADGSQHVPLADFKTNLKRIVTHPKVQAQRPRVILVTPPPINEYACELTDTAKGIRQPRRKADHTALYAQAVRDVAAELEVTLLDLYQVFMDRAGQKPGESVLEGSKQKPLNSFLRIHLVDGLHMTNLGYVIFFEELLQTIAKVWPDQTAENLRFVVPPWDDKEAWAKDPS